MRGQAIKLSALLCVLALMMTACIMPLELDEPITTVSPTDEHLWQPGSTEPSQSSTEPSQNSTEPSQSSTEPTQDPGEPSVYCEYDMLSANSQSIYDAMYHASAALETTYRIRTADEEAVSRAFEALYADHPEFFWLGGGYSYQTVTLGSQTEISLMPCVMSTNNLGEMVTELNAAAEPVLARARTLPTVYEQILYIHDYIVENTQYDDEAADMITSGQAEWVVLESSTAYGCLVRGKAVCAGYAKAFQYLAQALGYRCGRALGDANGGWHEWNYIMLDDEYYFMDVTWDDPNTVDGAGNSKRYNYFCITSEEMEKDHTTGGERSVPMCNGTKYDYYRYNERFFETYSFETVAKLVESWSEGAQVEMKFATEAECQRAVQDLMNNSRIYEIDPPAGTAGAISYVASGSVLTINF